MSRTLNNTASAQIIPYPEQKCCVSRQPVASRGSRRRRRRLRLPLLLGLLLFLAGFVLGAARAAEEEAPDRTGGRLEEQAAGVPSDTAALAENQSVQADRWELRLVNADHPLPEDFSQPELTELKGGHAIDSRAYPALQRMMDDCRAEGLEPLICSSYRTYGKQEELFQNKVSVLLEQGYSQEAADAEAARWVARPGTSEHETGLAVDIVDTDYQILDRKQEQTPVQQWLITHCAQYGFILRYPTDKSDLTGIGYEPWHYRYVGKEAAERIMEQGLCLEEYPEIWAY